MRHVCRDCQKLGPEVRDIERCLTYEGFVRRKCRKVVERFLGHEDLRLRAWAEELLARRITFDDDEIEFDDDEIEPSDLFAEDQ